MEFVDSIKAISGHSSRTTLREDGKVEGPGSGDKNSAVATPDTEIGQKVQPDCGIADGLATFWRGRVALYAILKALGIGRGDQVVVPGYTCFAVPSAVCFAGARPIFADIEPATFNVSLGTIAAALRSSQSGSVKAILIQHTYGIPAETQPIVSWARERGIATIEDCAHAWGSRYRDTSGAWLPVGSLADASFFSSQWTKPVSTGLGGWATSSNPKLRAALDRFRSECCVSPSKADIAVLAAQVGMRKLLAHPRIDWAVKKVYQALYTRGLVLGTSSKEELRGEMPAGYAKRMSSFQARLLRRSLGGDSIVAHRRHLKSVYDRALEAVAIPMLHVPEGIDPVLLRYPVRVRNKAWVLAEAKRRGFDIGDWYSHPIDRPESLSDDVIGYQTGSCPEGERAAREVVNLPLSRGVTEELALRMVECVKKFA
jgi:dTDP-4-amino-4,6-dideoxygalactose transaminase